MTSQKPLKHLLSYNYFSVIFTSVNHDMNDNAIDIKKTTRSIPPKCHFEKIEGFLCKRLAGEPTPDNLHQDGQPMKVQTNWLQWEA